jgi:beta-lactamase class A
MSSQSRASLLTALLILAHPAAHAQDAPQPTPARAQMTWVVRNLNDEPALAAAKLHDRLTDEFRAQVTPEVLAAQYAQLAAMMGEGPIVIDRYDTGETDRRCAALVRSADTNAPLRIGLAVDETGRRIAMLRSVPVAEPGKLGLETWEDLDAAIDALHGRASAAAFEIVTQNDRVELRPIHTLHADERLAIGSAFKLYVLGALAELVERGDAAWDQPLEIRDDLKSLPTGTMQNEPAGAAHPVSRFVNLMISISDNTAADHLLNLVGRQRVEAYMARHQDDPGSSLPFLSTLEMFKIKLSGDPDLARRYAEAGEDDRRAMLAPGGDVAAARPKMLLASMWAVPQHVDRIEWFATTAELCRVMADLHRLESLDGMEPLARALRLNPGMGFMRDTWPEVAFKGGSEPGVLNLTWMVERADGRLFALALTWNDTERPVDTLALLDIAAEAFGLLRD